MKKFSYSKAFKYLTDGTLHAVSAKKMAGGYIVCGFDGRQKYNTLYPSATSLWKNLYENYKSFLLNSINMTTDKFGNTYDKNKVRLEEAEKLGSSKKLKQINCSEIKAGDRIRVEREGKSIWMTVQQVTDLKIKTNISSFKRSAGKMCHWDDSDYISDYISV